MVSHPEPYVRLPAATHKTTIILLHGTSQTGPKFAESFLPALFSPPYACLATPSTDHIAGVKVSFPEYFPNCKFVFPTGASRRATVFGGRETNAWFDIADFGDRTKGEMYMIEGLRQSSLYLANLVRTEIELLDGEGDKDEGREGNVVVAGFSQGSAMGLMLLLGGELQRQGLLDHLGGFIGLSGWLPFRRQIEELMPKESERHFLDSEVATKRNNTTAYVRELLGLVRAGDKWSPNPESLDIPVFLGHGELDVKMKFEWGLQLRDTLEQLEMEVDFKSYAGLEHWWNEQEMTDVAEFLHKTWQGIK